jgi:hypothetical protein
LFPKILQFFDITKLKKNKIPGQGGFFVFPFLGPDPPFAAQDKIVLSENGAKQKKKKVIKKGNRDCEAK